MSAAKGHYERLLGGVYTWSVSSREDPFARAAAWLAKHDLARAASYLDLGAGFGAHTVPLARAGRSVTAVDFDRSLVTELRKNLGADAMRVSVREGDVVDFLSGATAETWDVILCAGDTITHLPTLDTVHDLLAGCARQLAPGGTLALSFRDSTGPSLQGTARFIEVARDARRTMHCLLEPIDDDHLRVTDLVTEVGPDGPKTRISDYVKLRLSPARVIALANEVGLSERERTEEGGMTTLLVVRSA